MLLYSVNQLPPDMISWYDALLSHFSQQGRVFLQHSFFFFIYCMFGRYRRVNGSLYWNNKITTSSPTPERRMHRSSTDNVRLRVLISFEGLKDDLNSELQTVTRDRKTLADDCHTEKERTQLSYATTIIGFSHVLRLINTSSISSLYKHCIYKRVKWERTSSLRNCHAVPY